ncbi:MAG TPA: carboxypeptidase-like regulatory domain-containing protein [Bryobacteraceae bacterium]|nr:carboxypeptidase-like regulatory domain-containing protein [Bryobacteraceae bacterium]
MRFPSHPESISALLIFLAAALANAQNASTGRVSGLISDTQSAAVNGASVSLIEVSTRTIRSTKTNEAGRYDFPNVEPGTYDLSVDSPGFSIARLSSQKVDVGMILTLNVGLEIGTVATTVEVKASAGAELQTLNSTVGNTITGDSLLMLPNFQRDANALATLQVGVTPSGQVAGVQTDQNSFTLDGGNNSDDMSGSYSAYTTSNGGGPSGVVPTPVESVEEFKVAISNQTADFNGAGGSLVQMVTKRGTNQFHGALYDYYFASNVGAANTWKNNHTASGSLPYTPLPSTHRNRFGGALGGPALPRLLGGKTYFFVNYEGYRYPNATTVEKSVPTALLRAGVVQIPNSAGVYQAYNLNPYPVTVNGVTYQPAVCGAGQLCDPRGLGLNPIVSQIWSKYMPMPNDPQAGDQYNTQGYRSNVNLPVASDFGVIRLDHDFGSRNHFMVSDRYYVYNQLTSNQIDIGGALPGDKFGQATAYAPRPQTAHYLVAALTTTITPNLTNDFHFNFLRNFWAWSTAGGAPQLPGLPGAVEIGGETSNALIPYNVDTGSTRQRAWNGHDQVYRDDLSYLHGFHFLQFGGSYQRNSDFYTRNDNGIATDASLVYQIGNGSGISMGSAYLPAGIPSSQVTNWSNLYAEVLGLVSQPQVMYTRAGKQLNLNPIGDPISIHAIVPSYNLYLTDTWRLRPSFTLNYGLGYQIEMPPYELRGKQVQLVDTSDNPISLQQFLQQKQSAALAGGVYEPTVGFAITPNVAGGPKYPFHPFYGQFSPRVAAAWNPNFKDGFLHKIFGDGATVIRGGYSRIYGRLNGGRVVGSPVLGAGLEQVIQCIGASRSGQCLGINGVDPTTAFRIGADGLTAPLPAVTPTLPQPYFPGVNGNATAGDGAGVDINFRPDRSDEFNFTIQRALSQKIVIEAGYIGRIIRNEYNLINIDAVPTMTTLGGQTFANAFANLYQEVSGGQAIVPQPFFETALGGAGSKYCGAYASCTAAVAAQQKSAIVSTQVYNLWSALNAAPSWILGRTLLASPAVNGGSVGTQLTSYELAASNGWGNYNAAFLSFTAKDWHGLTARSNFTWGRAMGTGASAQSSSSQTVLNPWDLQESYGPQPFDIHFIYNLSILYREPFFRSQRGVLGRLLGGWTIAPLFTAQSGSPLQVSIGTGTNTNAQSFGEVYGNGNSASENAVLMVPYTGGNSVHENVTVASGAGVNGNASKGGSGLNMFADPNAVYGEFRRLILGLDTTGGGAGVLRGLPTWNLDATLSKEIRGTERIGATVLFQFTNVLNHFQASNPSLNIDSPQTFGVITGQANTPRQMEFGLRVHF